MIAAGPITACGFLSWLLYKKNIENRLVRTQLGEKRCELENAKEETEALLETQIRLTEELRRVSGELGEIDHRYLNELVLLRKVAQIGRSIQSNRAQIRDGTGSISRLAIAIAELDGRTPTIN